MNWFKKAQSTTEQAVKLVSKDRLPEVKSVLDRTSKPFKHYAYVSYLLSKSVTDNHLFIVISEVESLFNENKINNISANESGVTIIDGKNNKYNADTIIKFQEALHAIESSYKPLVETSADSLEEMKHKIVYEGSNITIYKADGPGDCITLGEGQTFCISRKDSQNMYHTYRNDYQSTFYFVYDRNFKETEPLSLVVVDAQEDTVKLTDKRNNTGTIDIYTTNTNEYLNYLRGKGVPVDNLVNNPLSEEEIEENKKLGNKNTSLEWFKELTRGEKYKYISRYHQLTGDQFKEISSDKELLQKYLSIGHPLEFDNIKLLNNNQKSIYKHAREKLITNSGSWNIVYSDCLLFGKDIFQKTSLKRILIGCGENGQLKDLKYMIEEYPTASMIPNINYVLTAAAENNNFNIVKYIFKYYGERITSNSINSVLQQSATYGIFYMFKYLLDKYPKEIDTTTINFSLENASNSNRLDILYYIIDNYENIIDGYSVYSALQRATSFKDIEIINILTPLLEKIEQKKEKQREDLEKENEERNDNWFKDI